LKSFAFFDKNITVPGIGISESVQNPLSAEITLNSNFTCLSCCGIANELPMEGYSAQLNWQDGKQDIGQVELVAFQKQVVVEIDWQPPNSNPLPSWAWDAMFAAGTKILLEVKEDGGSMLYHVRLTAGTNSWDSGWLSFLKYYPPVVCECVLVGFDDDMRARFIGLDASFKMGFSTQNVQYAISKYGGSNSLPRLGDTPDPVTNQYPVIGEMAQYRITGEESNADQDDLDTSLWTFKQKTGA